MADTYLIEKIKVTIDSTAYERKVAGGVVSYDIPVAKYDKAITITAITGKKNGNAYNNLTGSFVDEEGTAVNPLKVPVPNNVYIKIMDGAAEAGKVRITVKFLLKILQEKGDTMLWVGVGDAPDVFFDPKAKYANGTPLEVTPTLGWLYVDASSGAFWIYDGTAWNDTGEKWTGGSL